MGWRKAALAAWSGFRRLGHTVLPSTSPCFPRGHFWTMARDAGDLPHLPRRAQGDKAAFSSAPELWGSGRRGARSTQRAPPPASHCLSVDNGRPLLGFYTSSPVPSGPAGDILPPPHSQGDSKGTDAP